LPTETGRIIKRKRVQLPSGGTVDIPVVTQITFLDVVNQGQESEFHIENSGAAHRDVHVAGVPGGGEATDESGSDNSGLQVERVDVWRVLDVVDRGQESFIHLDNKTIKEPPDAPPYFTTHEKTHIVKYINTPDDGNWIKSELIDRFKVLDTVDQAQESEYFLSNPPDNTGISGLTLDTDSDGNPTVAVDPSLPDISDSSNGVDPPWRTDPFQNIIDFSGGVQPEFSFSIYVSAFLANQVIAVDTGVSINDPAPDGAQPTTPPFNGSGLLHNGWMVSYALTVVSQSQVILPASTQNVPAGAIPLPGGAWLVRGAGPSVSISPSTFSFDDWKVYNEGILNQTPFNPCNANIPTTPPLVVNGKTQVGWYGSLSLAMAGSGAGYERAPMTFDVANVQTQTWVKSTVAPLFDGVNPGSAVQIPTNMTLNISGLPFTPFTFTSLQYRAVGIGGAGGFGIGVPPFIAGVTPGSAATIAGELIFCVAA
jgi:hypothetical protein